jgi:hypothetical protein
VGRARVRPASICANVRMPRCWRTLAPGRFPLCSAGETGRGCGGFPGAALRPQRNQIFPERRTMKATRGRVQRYRRKLDLKGVTWKVGSGSGSGSRRGADVRPAARLRSMLGGRAVKYVEHHPGWPAPASGVYRLVNIFGNNMSTPAHVVRGALLPAAPNGFRWRLERETDEPKTDETR